MRAAKTLLAAGLLGSAGAALPSVFTFDQNSNSQTGNAVATISPENARLFFAHRLHLSQYHDLKDASDETLDILNAFGGKQMPLFGSEDADKTRRILVIVEGVENPEGNQTRILICKMIISLPDDQNSLR